MVALLPHLAANLSVNFTLLRQLTGLNILFIMADDLGVGEPSFTSPGLLSTPNIDQLAADGMTFTAAYAGYTVCAPSRATLFTGRHSGHLKGAPGNWPVLPRLLRDAGYETRIFGKSAPMDAVQKEPKELEWGLPEQFGFEGFHGQPNQARCHNMYPDEWTVGNETVRLSLNRKARSRKACMAQPELFNYSTDLFADAAIHWLRHRDKGASRRPFFAYLSFTVPHAGGWGSAPKNPESGQPVPTNLQYANRSEWPEVERDHAASVAYLDKRVGDVLEALKETGLERETVIFFASDNGAHNEGSHDVHFFNSSGGLRGWKRSFYEGGVRSPSIVKWPGVVAPGSVSAVPWAFWDVLPTLLDIAGAPVPRDAAKLDGRSIVPALKGERMAPPPYLYWTWRVSPMAEPGYAARVGEWKAVVKRCADKSRRQPSMNDDMELYDLSSDPSETTNVAAGNEGVVKGIKRLLVQEGDLSCRCLQC